MLVRLACGVVLAAAFLAPGAARADCAQEVSRLMSRDTEMLSTRYQKVSRQIEQKGANPGLVAEECRIVRQLGPRLADQIAALKQSGCSRDPSIGQMIADIVRGHEDDLAAMRKSASRSECR
jgi:hypothetical protein